MPDRATSTPPGATLARRQPRPGADRIGTMALTARRPGHASGLADAFLAQASDLLAAACRENRGPADAEDACAARGAAFPCPRAQLAGSALSPLDRASPAGPIRQQWTFPGSPDQVREARHALAGFLAGCPRADDAVLCVSELASNAVLHSASGQPGGTFAVRAAIRPCLDITIEVRDQGGPWQAPARQRMHGLGIVAELAELTTHQTDDGGRIVTACFTWLPAGPPCAGQPVTSKARHHDHHVSVIGREAGPPARRPR
jgi:serine/threonine-protein kinase RsbW